MNKRERKELEGWIRETLLEARKKLFLDKYDDPIIETMKQGNYLEIVCNYPYLDYIVRYSPAAEEDYKIRRPYLRKALYHEMCHLVLAPMKMLVERPKKVAREELIDINEHTTDHIRRIVMQHG